MHHFFYINEVKQLKQRLQFILYYHSSFLFFIDSQVYKLQRDSQTAEESKQLSPQELVDSQLKALDLTDLKKFWEDIQDKYGGFLPESQKGSLYDFIKGEKKFSFKQWAIGILKFVFHEFVANGKLLGSLDIIDRF